MKILSLYVENFGALHELNETFDEGFNLRLRPNGWGKSTLAVFVKVMLFGLPSSTKRSLIENERKRYAPWQGGTWGGTLDMEVEGKAYRIERTLGPKESEDVFRVIDLATGEPADTSWASSPGECLFGVDSAAYERTTYLSQRPDDALADGSDSIHTKLNRLMDATNDIANYDTAIRALDTKRRYYRSNTTGNGAVADLEGRLSGLRNMIGQKKAQVDALNALLLRRNETRQKTGEAIAESNALHARLEKLNHALESRAIQDRYEALLLEEQGYRRQAASLREKLGGKLPEEKDLTSLADAIAALRRAEAALPPAPDEKEAGLREKLQSEALLFAGTDENAAENLTILARKTDETALLLREAERITPAREEYSRLLNAFPDAVAPEGTRIEELSALCRALSDRHRDAAGKKADAENGQSSAEQEKSRCHKRLRIRTLLLLFCLPITLGLGVAGLWKPLFYIIAAGFGTASLLPLLFLRSAAKKKLLLSESRLAEAEAAVDTAEETLQALLQEENHLYTQIASLGESLPADLSEALTALETVRRRLEQLNFCREQCAREDARESTCKDAFRDASEAFSLGWQTAFPAFPAPQPAEDRTLQEAVQSAYHRLSEFRRQQADLTALDNARRCAEAGLEECRKALSSLLMPYPGLSEKPEEALDSLRAMRQEILWNTQEAAAKRNESEALRLEKLLDTAAFRASLALAASENLQELQNAIAENENTQKALSLRSLSEEQEYRRLGNSGEELETLENELAVCEAQYTRAKSNLTTIENARNFLEKARTSLSSRYLSRMKDSFGSYIALLTGEETPAFTMDSEFQVSIRASGIGRKSESFGRGMRDLIAFCERLSLVDAMYEGERPFLVLDDPFVNLDDPTVERAQVLLHALSQRYQILYLSCSESRA